jgi:hypothetical protein
MWNIVIGILLVVAGLSGRFTLIGTNNPMLLVLFGVGLVVWGVVQVSRRRR